MAKLSRHLSQLVFLSVCLYTPIVKTIQMYSLQTIIPGE